MVVSAVSSAQSVASARGTGRSCSILYTPPDDQRRKLADAVAEAQARLLDRDVEELFEQPDLGQLHGDDRADILDEGFERGRFASEHPRREIDLLPQHVAAQSRCPVERGSGRPVHRRDAQETRHRARGSSSHSRETRTPRSRSAS